MAALDFGMALARGMLPTSESSQRDLLNLAGGRNVFKSEDWWNKAVELQKKGKTADEIIKAIEGDNNLRKWAGSRPKHCPIGASASAHRIERMEGAIDCVVGGMSGKALFDMVEAKAKEFYGAGVRRMEDHKDATTWLHLDRRINTTPKTIRVVGIKSFVRNIFAG